MRKTRQCFSSFIPLLLVLLTGCVNIGKGTQNATHFYRLESSSFVSESESGRPQADTLSGDLTILVAPVRIPGYLKRSQIVTRSGLNEFRLAEFERWAEPLGDNIARVLAEDLGEQLNTNRIDFYTWNHPKPPDLQVGMDILRFDGAPGGDVLLNARWSIAAPDSEREPLVQEASIREKLGGPGYPELVAAMSRSLAKLSRAIARSIRTAFPEGKIKTVR